MPFLEFVYNTRTKECAAQANERERHKNKDSINNASARAHNAFKSAVIHAEGKRAFEQVQTHGQSTRDGTIEVSKGESVAVYTAQDAVVSQNRLIGKFVKFRFYMVTIRSKLRNHAEHTITCPAVPHAQ